jgi:glycosyltransferase involved in cell wall biosynthesis
VVKERLKGWIFRILGKDPEAVVVSFASGNAQLCKRMIEEVHALVPDRRHFSVRLEELQPGSSWRLHRQLRRRFRKYRIGLAPVLFTMEPHPLRAAAAMLAPRKILAYNARLERHHLRLRSALASFLFLRGVPLDRIYLRPKWLVPWKQDRTVAPETYRVVEGRPFTPGRRRIAVLSPYFPYPLSHGGAVRIYHLMRETAREFDVLLFVFADQETDAGVSHLAEFCSQIVIVPMPRYREPRWSTLLPPEAHEFACPGMRRALEAQRSSYDLLQVEYTQLAPYGGDILVEHDVTFDLYGQVWRRERSAGAAWDYFRWRRFERAAVRRYRRVVVMSGKDAEQLSSYADKIAVIANGVDLTRFAPEPERTGRQLLFIGSFRHFPNIQAYRFFVQEVWPLVRDQHPDLRVTVVCGPDYLIYWRDSTGELAPPADVRIEMLGFVPDVRPLYVNTNLVLVPTVVSAGTNVKALEAMAMERAVISTPSGCAGLGLEHGKSVWIGETAAAFAAGIDRLIGDAALRAHIARNARLAAEHRFDWGALGEKQRACYREMLDAVK